MQPGEEREIGCANGWRYFIERSKGGALFWVLRKSMGLADHGRKRQSITVRDTEEAAEKAALDHMRRSEASAGGLF